VDAPHQTGVRQALEIATQRVDADAETVRELSRDDLPVLSQRVEDRRATFVGKHPHADTLASFCVFLQFCARWATAPPA
jgi:hypothetical protein